MVCILYSDVSYLWRFLIYTTDLNWPKQTIDTDACISKYNSLQQLINRCDLVKMRIIVFIHYSNAKMSDIYHRPLYDKYIPYRSCFCIYTVPLVPT